MRRHSLFKVRNVPKISDFTQNAPISQQKIKNYRCWYGINNGNGYGASGDTELFEKASNINGFQGGRVANNLYISPFRATVFKTAALFLYLNSSVVIRVRKPLFFSLWPPQAGGHGCFPMDHIREANRRLFSSKSTLFIFRGRRCEDGCIPYRKDQRLHGHVQLPSAGFISESSESLKNWKSFWKIDFSGYQPPCFLPWKVRGLFLCLPSSLKIE